MEPTPTQEPIIETDAVESQQWWLTYWKEVEKAAAKIENCEVSYEIVNARELGYVNTIPWTVDQHGETVMGVIPEFCGSGAYWAIGLHEDYIYFVNSILEHGFRSHVLGPEFFAYYYEDSYVNYVSLPRVYLGGVSQENFDQMRRLFGGYPPVMVVSATPDLVRDLGVLAIGRSN